MELYVQESKKFPPKRSVVESKVNPELCGVVASFNIMNNEITVKTEDGPSFRIPVSQIQASNKKIKHKHDIEEKSILENPDLKKAE